MSTNYGLNASHMFAAASAQHTNRISTARTAADFSNTTHYPLEYLDLSSSDGTISGSEADTGKCRDAIPLTEAEFYSFDDFLPNSTIIDLDYEDLHFNNNNKVTDHYYPTRSSRNKSGSTSESRDHPSDDIFWNLENGFKDIVSRTGSTCSGSSTSSHSITSSSRPFSLSAAKYEVGPSYAAQSYPNTSSKRKLPLRNAMSYMHSYPVGKESLSTDMFKQPQASHTDIEVLTGSSVVQENTKTKSDNQPQLSDRAEELLTGIVKLAEDDVLSEFSKTPTQPQHRPQQARRKPALKTSKSSPALSDQSSQSIASSKSTISKPSSPVNASKRISVSRKSSFTSHPADHDRRADKRNKLSEKLSNSGHVTAFLDAVEHFDLDKVASLLASDKSCINSLNSEGLTALDIAVLTNHVPMIKTLMKYGAQAKLLEREDNNLCTTFQAWISGAEQQVIQLKSNHTSTSAGSLKDNERKLNQWEFKHRLFRRMKTGYEQAGLPGQPQNVKLSVTSDSSLCVRFDSPEGSHGAVVTRYKVEWSKAQNFRPLVGEVIINDMHNLQYDIGGLEAGSPYFVRVTAWNMKGFGLCAYSNPLYAIPSSWRDVENLESRTNSFKTHKVNQITENVRRLRNCQENSDGVSSASSQQATESPTGHRKSTAPLMRGLRGLFSSSFKFQKTLKRGVYLACICYNEDKLLVTTEDNLPIVEVDESYSGSSLKADFDWLMKVVASSWDTARQLKQDLEKLSELSSVHLKNQLLSAILQLQEMMGMQDLGKLFYRPINDGNGSIVLAIVNQISDAKQVGNIASAVKWQSQSKLTKNSQPSDPLLPLLNEMIFFHQVSANQVPQGLYLGYLHIKFNAESIRVLAPENNPSVLPFIKIRDCPNVSSPEWKSLLDLDLSGRSNSTQRDTAEIMTFKKQLVKSSKKLADKLGISSEQLGDHRIYDMEVLDFSKNVSFILLMPPRDLVCSVKSQPTHTGTSDVTEPSSEYMEIPVKAFEMIHLQTYQNEFISAFSKSACLVDTQLTLAQHSQREAFSNEEIESSRKQVESARTYQHELEEVWRSTRWLVDAIAYARDRDRTTPGVTISHLSNSVSEQPPVSGDSFGKSSDDGYHSDKISLGGSTGSDKHRLTSNNQTHNNTNNNNGQYYDGELDYHHQPSSVASEQLKPGILRVYAAYNSGLAKGTSVMLHVTPRTTAREVVDLVVMQLNKEVIRKGIAGPAYVDEQLLDFCLVAVIGPRERVLRDDYKLLQLQNPWTKGKLYVRFKNNLLAALERGETTDV